MTKTLTGVLCALLSVTIFGQSKPDFSGKWTQIDPARNQPASTMEVSQDASTLTIATAGQGGATERVTLKLDGSEIKVTTPETGREHVSTAAWDRNRLVIATQAYSNGYGPYTMRQNWSLEGETLVIAVALISRTTGATFNESKMTFRKAN